MSCGAQNISIISIIAPAPYFCNNLVSLDTRQCVRQVRAKKPTHRPWVILHEPFRAKFDPPITQNLFYLRI
ncbi:hypothetical protein SFRURICE_016824 [Spodoptera frugiperda]|nr:hypothetical protein SFRURICE_016824 [Spodoptera frugiperda]